MESHGGRWRALLGYCLVHRPHGQLEFNSAKATHTSSRCCCLVWFHGGSKDSKFVNLIDLHSWLSDPVLLSLLSCLDHVVDGLTPGFTKGVPSEPSAFGKTPICGRNGL